MKEILFEDSQGNTLIKEGSKLYALNAKGQLVDRSGFSKMLQMYKMKGHKVIPISKKAMLLKKENYLSQFSDLL